MSKTKRTLVSGLGLLGCLLLAATVLADPVGPDGLLIPTGQPPEQPPQNLLPLQLGRIGSLVFSHRGDRLASSSEDGRICIWDLDIGHPIRCVQRTDATKGPVASLSWNAGDEWIAAGFGDGSSEPWQATANPKAPRPCQLEPLPKEPTLGRTTTSARFYGPGDAFLVIGARKDANRSCTGGSGPSVAHPALQDFPGTLFQRSATDEKGSLLAVAKDRLLGVWALQSGQKRWVQPALPSYITALAMSEDGRLLASGLIDGSVSIWDVGSGAERRLAARHRDAIRALSFSRDGMLLAAAADDGRVSLWDTGSGAYQREVKGQVGVTSIAFSPDGTKLAVPEGIGSISLWDVQTDIRPRTLSANVQDISGLAFSRDGSWLVTGAEDGVLRIWKKHDAPKPGESPWTKSHQGEPLPGAVQALAVQPVPKGLGLVAAASGRFVFLHRLDGSLRPDRTLALDDEVKQGPIRSLAFSGDGKWLALGTSRGWLGIADTAQKTWELKLHPKGHTDAIRALAFVPPEGQLLVTASLDQTVSIWKLPGFEKVHTFPAQPEGVKALAVSPSGKLLVMAAGKEVSVWDLQTRQLLQKLPHERAVSAIRFSGDGAQIATALTNGDIKLWDAASFAAGVTLGAADETSSGVALDLSPDGSLLAATSVGRVNLFGPASSSPQAQLWQAREDWACVVNGTPALLFRHETGGLIWTQDSKGAITPLPPPKGQDPQLEIREILPSLSADKRGADITVRVDNRAGGPAYWLRLEAQQLTESQEPRDRVSVEIKPPARHIRLDPGAGESVSLFLGVRARAGGHLPPREVRICLRVRYEHDSEPGSACQGARSQIVTLSLGPWWWRHLGLLFLIGGMTFALGLGVISWRRYRRALASQVVRAVIAERNALAGIRLSAVQDADAALQRASRLPGYRDLLRRALLDVGTDEHSWRRAVQAASSAQACAEALAESLRGSRTNLPKPRHESPDLAVFAFPIPPLSIHVPDRSVLIICTSSAMAPQTAIARCGPKDLGEPRFALLIDRTTSGVPQQTAAIQRALRESHREIRFVVLSEPELVHILLSRDAPTAKERLRRHIIEQSEPREIVPYLEGSSLGIPADESSFFFGRDAELDQLLLLRDRNFLLMGPRRMGKSSLINALYRELRQRVPDVSVEKSHLVKNGNLRSLQFDAPGVRVESPEAFYESVLARSQAHQIFLLDEVDSFLAEEKAAQYPFCSVMRALSAQGRASFVLAGHQELHEATRIPDHPLRNFGDSMHLGPLDPGSAERMIREPLSALGVRFANESEVVDWLREATGCRPHLLAIGCLALLRLNQTLAPEPRTLADVQQAVLSRELLQDVFLRWDGDTIHPLDRAVARITLLRDRPRPDDVMHELRQQGAFLTEEALEQSLTRLYAWHYAVIRDEAGRLYCPVPLFRFWLSTTRTEFTDGKEWTDAEERLRSELKGDLAALRVVQMETGPFDSWGIGSSPDPGAEAPDQDR